MKIAVGDQKANIFYKLAKDKKPAELFECFLPDGSVVPKILERLGLTPDDFRVPSSGAPLYIPEESYGVKVNYDSKFRLYNTIITAMTRFFWSRTNFDYDAEKKTVIVSEKTTLKVIDTLVIGKTKFRFVAGWPCNSAITTLLVRTLKGNSENEKNPFNEFRLEVPYLPDISYLPELYKILGVKNFADLRISETGDYRNLWRGVTTSSFVMIEFDNFTCPIFLNDQWKDGIPLLWYQGISVAPFELNYYLQRFPQVVLDRLQLIVAQNRKMLSPKKWQRDPFQAVLDRNLKGKDLIAVCASNAKFNALCNQDDQKLFRARLNTEFGIEWNKNQHGFTSPRELYVQLYRFANFILNRDGKYSLYTVAEKGLSSGQLTPEIISRAVSILAPTPKMKQFLEKKKTVVSARTAAHTLVEMIRYFLIVFFPSAPDLSFYIGVEENPNDAFFAGVYGRRPVTAVDVFSTEMLEEYVPKQKILHNIAQKVVYFMNHGGNFGQSLRGLEKFFELLDLDWLVKLSGDNDVIVYKTMEVL